MPFKIVILAGGLGNQLFQFAFSLNQGNQGTVIIEQNLLHNAKNSTGDPELHDFVLPGNSIWNNNPPKFSGLTKISNLLIRFSAKDKLNTFESIILPAILLSASFFFSVRYCRVVFCRVADGVGFFESKFFRNQVSVGYFQSYKWVQSNSVPLNSMKEMKLANNFEDLQTYEKLSKAEEPLCVHVRLGDYFNEPKIGILPDKYYHDALQYQFSKLNYKKIWLFSNDPEQAIGVIPPEFKSMVRIIESDLSSAQTLEVMRLCSGYVIANSSFSWWGAFLSKKDSPIVACPQKWFKISEDPKFITPPNWHKIISFP